MDDALAGRILAWYDTQARELPWRAPDAGAWAVLVSEVMLQQTPVARVLPAYRAWMARWDSPGALAAASAGDAVRMWGKLGYPRRAMRLHACAAAIVAQHGGVVPDDVAALEALPGIGHYTARAVASFAYRQRHPVVDTNVRRVVTRMVRGAELAGTANPRRDAADLEPLIPTDPERAARFAVAVMELGALVCTARAPRCAQCPVAHLCAWRLAGSPPADPADRPRAQRYEGTDRQARGRLLDVLRAAADPVDGAVLLAAWPVPAQRERALDSLVADGLIDPLPDGRFALPTSRPPRPAT